MKLTAESTVINDAKINTDIDTAQTSADNAQTTANQAKTVADNTAQYFWFTSSGTDTGAHISEKTQTQFISSPSGGNLLARSNGIAVRDGLVELASFGTTARIGKSNTRHIDISDGGMQVLENATTAIANIGYNGSTPYYTFGSRKENSTIGSYSFATGYNNIASEQYQFVAGRYNAANSDALFIIGAGTSEQYRENVFEVRKNGAVYIAGHTTPLGDSLYTSAGETGMSRNTGTTLCSLSVPIGSWILQGQVTFESNSSGIRRVVICDTAADTSMLAIQNWAGMQVSAASSGQTVINLSYFLTASNSGQTMYLNGLHTSSSDIFASNSKFAAIRVA